MKEHTLIWTAIHELKIDVPVMSYEIKGDPLYPTAITLHLYGGQVVAYSPSPIASDVPIGKLGRAGEGQQPAPAPKPAAPKPKKKISAD
jgi:hypothetical protein